MRKLTFAMNMSLDGYIAAPGDDLGWSVPSDELFQWWSDRVTVHPSPPGWCGCRDSSTLAQEAAHSADVNNVPGHNN